MKTFKQITLSLALSIPFFATAACGGVETEAQDEGAIEFVAQPNQSVQYANPCLFGAADSSRSMGALDQSVMSVEHDSGDLAYRADSRSCKAFIADTTISSEHEADHNYTDKIDFFAGITNMPSTKANCEALKLEISLFKKSGTVNIYAGTTNYGGFSSIGHAQYEGVWTPPCPANSGFDQYGNPTCFRPYAGCNLEPVVSTLPTVEPRAKGTLTVDLYRALITGSVGESSSQGTRKAVTLDVAQRLEPPH